jgi:LysR family nitrogen assimilation transcriptional regulator
METCPIRTRAGWQKPQGTINAPCRDRVSRGYELDIKRLHAFTKIIDLGSISRAANLLNIAQPALSQQLAGLEHAFKQQLVIRSKSGVTPTSAGRELYRHAQILIRQLDRAMIEVGEGDGPLVGKVVVGLSPYSSGSTISANLLATVRERLPGVTLRITEGFGFVYSEMVMTGRLDMAIIHGSGPMKGLSFFPLMRETFHILAPAGLDLPLNDSGAVELRDVAKIPLLLPPSTNFVRKRVDTAFSRKQFTPNIVAEIEALNTLEEGVAMGLGSTILPLLVANRLAVPGRSRVYPVCNSAIYEDVSLCVSDTIPDTEAALAVREILVDLVQSTIGNATLADKMAHAGQA